MSLFLALPACLLAVALVLITLMMLSAWQLFFVVVATVFLGFCFVSSINEGTKGKGGSEGPRS